MATSRRLPAVPARSPCSRHSSVSSTRPSSLPGSFRCREIPAGEADITGAIGVPGQPRSRWLAACTIGNVRIVTDRRGSDFFRPGGILLAGEGAWGKAARKPAWAPGAKRINGEGEIMLASRLRSLLSLAGLLALIGAGPVFASGPAVALVVSDGASFVADVQTKLMATGKFSTVDIINAASATPSVAQLQAYRAVLVWSNSGFADSVSLGDNLDTYLRGGGGVVIAVFANTDPGILDLRGAFATNGDFPMTVAEQSSGTELTLGTVHVPGSPLLAGVATFDGGTSSYYDPGTLTPGSVDVADWSN